jgi:hypothetical protein
LASNYWEGVLLDEPLKLRKGLLVFPDHVIPVQGGVRGSTETLEGF